MTPQRHRNCEGKGMETAKRKGMSCVYIMQCSLDSASQAKSSDNDGSPERPSVRSPVQQHYISHSSAPARRQPVPMDPVLQAERLKALQELEALRRPKEDELVLSQTGTLPAVAKSCQVSAPMD